ncbi:MAG: CAP domain-containing protein [Methanotrichaceae archaeon]|nr:CAP domain-containing protein [Methanotrichaceae archaeon]
MANRFNMKISLLKTKLIYNLLSQNIFPLQNYNQAKNNVSDKLIKSFIVCLFGLALLQSISVAFGLETIGLSNNNNILESPYAPGGTKNISPTFQTISPEFIDAESLESWKNYSESSAYKSMSSEILSAHNKYRAEVNIPPLVWSDTLASGAQEWADYLATLGRLQHSNSGYGENLWMGSPPGYFSYTQMVDGWGSEKQYFVYGIFPNVSSTGNWADVGHYTQIIWKNTLQCGCAKATGGNWDYFVCRYNPPGNYIGQYVFRITRYKIGVFRSGLWYLDANGDRIWNLGNLTGTFGVSGDQPATGDWNAKGRHKLGIFRSGSWYLDANGDRIWNLGDLTGTFGVSGDQPVANDWNGDYKDEIGVFRSGSWYLDANGDRVWGPGDLTGTFGVSGDLPVAGDWNGDGKDEIGVLRGGTWYLDASGDRVWSAGDLTGSFGVNGDLPVAGDWNSDGKDEIGVSRGAAWYLDANGDRIWGAGDLTGTFGMSGDLPIVGYWN